MTWGEFKELVSKTVPDSARIIYIDIDDVTPENLVITWSDDREVAISDVG